MLRMLGSKILGPRVAPQLRVAAFPAARPHLLSAPGGSVGAAMLRRASNTPSMVLGARNGVNARCFSSHAGASRGTTSLRETARLCRPLCRPARRSVCTPAGSSSDSRAEAFAWFAQNRAVLVVAGGALLVMYGFYRISIRMMSFFLNVSPQHIFTAGMGVGAVTTALALLGLRTGRRYLSVRVDDVFAAANHHMRSEPARATVESALGEFWQPGKFRGYAMESFEEAVKGSERRVRSSYWEMPSQRVQMVFEVKGIEHRGVVSLEAFKRRGLYHFEMLHLDVPTTGAHHLLAGDKDRPLFDEIVFLLEGAKKNAEAKKAKALA